MIHSIDYTRTQALIEQWEAEKGAIAKEASQKIKELVLPLFDETNFTPSLKSCAGQIRAHWEKHRADYTLHWKATQAAQAILDSDQSPIEALESWLYQQKQKEGDPIQLAKVRTECLEKTPGAILYRYQDVNVDPDLMIEGLRYLMRHSDTKVDQAHAVLDRFASEQKGSPKLIEQGLERVRTILIGAMYRLEEPILIASLTPREARCLKRGDVSRLGERLKLAWEASQHLAKTLSEPKLSTTIDKQGSACFTTYRLLGRWH